MSSLSETTGWVHALLRGTTPAGVAATQLQAVPERVEAYQRYVRNHIHGALTKNYCTFADLVGAARWHAISDVYFREFPADDYELNACARHFPDLVAQLVATKRFSLTHFHVELASVERREFEVYVSREEIPDPIELCRAALNPTLQIVAAQFPVGSFVRDYRAWQNGTGEKPGLPDHPSPETVFLFRHPRSLSHQLIVADDALLFAFKVVADDIDLAVAASTAGAQIAAARGALLAAARAGLIVLPESDSSRPTRED